MNIGFPRNTRFERAYLLLVPALVVALVIGCSSPEKHRSGDQQRNMGAAAGMETGGGSSSSDVGARKVLWRGPHEERVEWVREVQRADGTIENQTNRYTRVATGLNRWNGTEWVPADPSFEIVNGRGVLRFLQHQATVAANANAPEGLIDLQMPGGQRLVLQTAGVALTG